MKSVNKNKIIFLMFFTFLLFMIPTPVPHMRKATFPTLFGLDESTETVSATVKFVHWKPVFFNGLCNGYIMGEICINNSTDDHVICCLKMAGEVNSYQEGTFCVFSSYTEKKELKTYNFHFIWENTLNNIMLRIQPVYYDEKLLRTIIEEPVIYMGSREELSTNEIQSRFCGYNIE